jgi:hypothetical protein
MKRQRSSATIQDDPASERITIILYLPYSTNKILRSFQVLDLIDKLDGSNPR